MSLPAAKAPLIFLVAGEPSGDLLGARLMAALKAEAGGRIAFAGVGGPLMEAEGLKSLFPIGELAMMGLVEVVRHIPAVMRRIDETVAAVKSQRPALFLSIDSPGFSLRVAKKLKGEGIPLVHYVAPQVWAWKPGRAKKVAHYLDHLLCLLPFEPPYFTRYGLPASFVGHSAVEAAGKPVDVEAFRQRHAIPAKAPLLCALPGSRRAEVERLAPVMGETLRRLNLQIPDLHVVVPTVPNVASLVQSKVADWPVPTKVVEGQIEKYEAFAACRLAIAASGTVALELAVAGLPALVLYKVNVVSALIGGWMIKSKWVSLASLVLGRLVHPEFLQFRCRAGLVAPAALKLWHDGPERQKLIDDGKAAAIALGQGGEAPSLRAARIVLSLIGTGERPGKLA